MGRGLSWSGARAHGEAGGELVGEPDDDVRVGYSSVRSAGVLRMLSNDASGAPLAADILLTVIL